MAVASRDHLARLLTACSLQETAAPEHARQLVFAFWLARGKGFAGWVSAIEGQLKEGRAPVTEGLAELGSAGIRLYGPEIRAMLADIHFQMGRSDKALENLDEALDIGADTGLVWSEAELHRLKGVLLQDDLAAAEAEFRKPLEIARAQQSKVVRIARRREPRPAPPRPGPPRRSPRPPRSSLRLVHRGLRHTRSEGGKGAAR
jgi:predicted ATPase